MVIRDMQITGDGLLISAATLVRRNVGIPSDEQISVAVAAAIQLARELEKQTAAGYKYVEWSQREPYDDFEVHRKEMNR